MMGGTGLLEELLAEQAAKANAQQELDTEKHSNADVSMVAPTSHSSLTSLSSRVAAEAPTEPAQWAPGFEQRLRDLDSAVVASTREAPVAAPTSPLSRQIEELAREMDDCLGSIDQWESQWEEDKRRHRQNLLSELEAQYGVDYGLDLATEDGLYRAGLGLTDSFCVEEAELDKSDLISSPTQDVVSAEARLLLPAEVGLADEMLARLREEDIIERCKDEARISQLRAEVEGLRIKAECDSDSHISPAAMSLGLGERHLHHPGTPHPGLVLDASLSGLDSGLQAWRDEVDSVLAEQCFQDDSDSETPRGIALMEGHLAGARERVRLLEDAVESAHAACAEGEFAELDQLLSECEELHERLVHRGLDE